MRYIPAITLCFYPDLSTSTSVESISIPKDANHCTDTDYHGLIGISFTRHTLSTQIPHLLKENGVSEACTRTIIAIDSGEAAEGLCDGSRPVQEVLACMEAVLYYVVAQGPSSGRLEGPCVSARGSDVRFSDIFTIPILSYLGDAPKRFASRSSNPEYCSDCLSANAPHFFSDRGFKESAMRDETHIFMSIVRCIVVNWTPAEPLPVKPHTRQEKPSAAVRDGSALIG